MTSASRRVVISGVGIVSPVGNEADALWDALSQRRSGVAPLAMQQPEPPGRLPIRFGAEARQFSGDIDNFGPLEKEQKKAIRKGLKMMCRECQMGVAVAQRALADAKISAGTTDPDRCGVIFGTDYMLSIPEDFSEGILQCADEEKQFHFSRWGGEGLSKMQPLWLLKYLPNMPASHVAIYNDFRGPNNSLTMREAAANASAAESLQIIQRGNADVMVVGATGTRLHPMKLLHAVIQEEIADGDGDPTTFSRPFDRDRRGMVLGEGAGSVVLEELGSAQARGATIYGEVIAAATSAVVGPRLSARRDTAIQNVLESILRASGLRADDIGHIHAHGLSTRSCDADEARAIHAVFGGRAKPVPIVAAKSCFGNLGAGSGAVELVASLLALRHDRLFPVQNFAVPDAECPISPVLDDSTPSGSTFINLSITPQAQASAVLVRRWE